MLRREPTVSEAKDPLKRQHIAFWSFARSVERSTSLQELGGLGVRSRECRLGADPHDMHLGARAEDAGYQRLDEVFLRIALNEG